MIESIVVGVDGSSQAAAALRWALHEAELHECGLTATMVWDYLNQHHPDGSTVFDPEYDAGAAQFALDRFVAAALGEHRPDRVGTRPVFELPARGLVEASKSASLLVLGARGLGGFRELLLGSVSHRCLQDATCAVAIVRTRAETPSHHGRVVVGVDGSADGQAALGWGAQEASVRGAVLRVVHAAESAYIDVPLPKPVRAADVMHKEANAVLEQSIAKCGLPMSLTVEVVPATGSPAKALFDASHDADLIVVGRAGRSLIHGRAIGSVAAQISHHSKIPAVFVRSNHEP